MSGLTVGERRELREHAAAEAKRKADAQSGVACAMCCDAPLSDTGRFEQHLQGLLAPYLKNAKPYSWHATYSYGAPLPPGGMRPPVLGGECARCLAAPPYHERWCPKRMECAQ